jgi:hypothetical protein
MCAITRKATFLVLATLLLSSFACKKTDRSGTFILLKFEGMVASGKPIATIEVDLQLGSQSDSASFPAQANSDITLPTSAALEIQSGEGDLTITARARAKDGTKLGVGSGSGKVVSGQTVTIPINIKPATETDAQVNTDGPGPVTDGSISDETGAMTGGAGGAGGIGTGGNTGMGGSTGGTYILSLASSLVDFGSVLAGTVSAPQPVILTNTGTEPGPELVIFIGDGKHFPMNQDNCSGMKLKPKEMCKVSFTFNPEAAGNVQTEGSIGPTSRTGAKFTLSGTGYTGKPGLTLSPTTIDFQGIKVGGTTSHTFTVTNNGDADAGTLSIKIDGSSAFQIINDQCSKVSLGKQGQCMFTLLYAPQTVGQATAKIIAQSTSGQSVSSTATAKTIDVVQLTIQFSGNGGGTVTGPNITCASGTPCTIGIERTDPVNMPKLVLSAQPNSTSQFAGWSDGCVGTNTCSIIMDAPKTVTANFTTSGTAKLSLNVLGLNGQTGTIMSEDGSISCSGSCPGLSVAASTNLTLVAKPGSNSTFAGWSSGPCRGISQKCTFAMSDGINIMATFGPQSYMFVTSSTVVPGKLGGINGADVECQRLADKANLPGSYKAWLSTKGTDAKSRIGRGGWIRADGRPFTLNIDNLTNAARQIVYYPPRLDELGNDLGNSHNLVATGGNIDGTAFDSQCTDFTNTTGGVYVGDTAAGSFDWAMKQLDPDGCGRSYRLYCFRSDFSPGEIAPPSQPGRRVFVSSRPFIPLNGISGADVLCQTEAKNANLSNAAQFVAFLATSTTPAIKRISPNGLPWKRIDEVSVVRQISDFVNGKLIAPITLTADGGMYTNAPTWAGATAPDGTSGSTCQDWTVNQSTSRAMVGISNTTAAPDWFSLGSNANTLCDDANTHLICIEP